MSEFIAIMIATFSWLSNYAAPPPPEPAPLVEYHPYVTYDDGSIIQDGERKCVNGAPCSEWAGDDSSKYTFDWNVEPRIGIDGQESEPITKDEIQSVLDELGYNPETGVAEG